MAVPQTMTAISITTPGGPDVLQPVTVPVPQPKSGQILVKVATAGVNRPDVQQRMGAYPPPKDASPLPGLEIAGEVVAVGADAPRWKVGDKVCALVNGGGYAEYCIAEETAALPIPAGLDMTQAGAVPETYFTVWHNVFERGGLQAGEWFLVHGGSSGIGTTAIQLAKAFGAKVLATAGSEEKCEAMRQLGCDRAINYKTEDFEAVVREAGGADVILDMVGAPYLAKNVNAAKPLGRIVSIAQLQGAQAEINLMLIMLKRLTLTGSTLRSRTVDEKARIAREVERVVWPWIEAGKLKPAIDSTFPLSNAEAAMQRLESGGHAGKIVMTV